MRIRVDATAVLPASEAGYPAPSERGAGGSELTGWGRPGMQAEDPVEIGEYKYIGKPDHRDGTPTKSQWTVSVPDEQNCFRLGVHRKWISESAAWGLHIVNGSGAILGRTAPNREAKDDLIVAFFQLADVCHGYPSDPRRSVRELPPNSVTSDWLKENYLRASVVRKLQRGQPCGPYK
jgi:hypothetical protein